MTKKLLVILIMMLIVSFALPAVPKQAAAQGPTPSFTVQTIPVAGLETYNMKVSPDGRLAAVFVGQTARNIFGIPITEYTVELGYLPIRLVDLTTGTQVGQIMGLTDYIGDLAFSPDGQHLATYQNNGDLAIWDVATLKLVRKFSGVMGGAKLAFMPDGKTLVVQMSMGMIGHFFVWDIETGHITAVWHTPRLSFGQLNLSQVPGNFDNQYVAFALSPDGTQLATANLNGEVLLWDTATQEQTMVQPQSEKPASVNIQSLAFSADGSQLVYYDRETESTHFWDVAAGSEASVLPTGGAGFALSPQGDVMVWVADKQLWYARLDQIDVATTLLTFPEDLEGAMVARAPRLVFSPDGRQLVVGEFYQRANEANVLYVITFE